MAKTSAIRVRTRFESVDDFVVGYSPFFDSRGLFIRTRRVQGVGTRLRFELQLATGDPVFRGEGIVDEVRQPPLSASGMHLRISKLDSRSKALFERITADIDHVSENPFEAPTYDPDKPNVVMAGAAARILSAAAEGSETLGDKRAAPAPPSPVEPEPRGEAEAARLTDSGDSSLDAGVLDEIADSIELSLDSVWSSSSPGAGGAADLGGYFGSPAVLAEAGMTPPDGEPVVSVPPEDEFEGPELLGEGVELSGGLEPELGGAAAQAPAAERLALNLDDPFHLSSPGRPAESARNAAGAALEFLAEDEFEDDEEEIYEAEILETDEHEPNAAEVLFASAEFEVADDEVSEDVFEVSVETPIVEEEGELGLGDHSLAIASNYVPPEERAGPPAGAETGRVATDAESLDRLVPDEAVAAAPETIPTPEAPAGPKRQGPDLKSLAHATLEHVSLEDDTHRRYTFATGEHRSGLGLLLHDLLEEETAKGNVPPALDVSILTGEHAVAEKPAGPDAIDELLARQAVEEEQETRKSGIFKRIFGRKKK